MVAQHAGLPWLPVEHDRSWTVEVEAEDENSVLSYYRHLAKLRHGIEALTAGDYMELLPSDESIYAFRRTIGAEATVTLVNFTGEEAAYDADIATVTLVNFTGEETAYDADIVKGMKLLTDSYPAAAQEDEEPGRLRPYEAVVYVTPEAEKTFSKEAERA